jgi:hypothetical protein
LLRVGENQARKKERERDLDGVYRPCPIRCSYSESSGALYIVRWKWLEKETVRGMMYNTKQEGNEMKEKKIPSQQLLN